MTTLQLIADRLQKSRPARILTAVLLGSGVGLALSALTIFDTLELKTLDFRFRYGAHAEWADTSIVMLAVDQNSLDFVERTWHTKYPWPREYYGLLLEYLEQAKPHLVAFDYDFSQRDIDRLETDGAESDQAFSSAIARAGNVVLGVNLSRQESGDQPGDSVLAKHLRPAGNLPAEAFRYDRATAPLMTLQAGAVSLGVTAFAADDDGIARRVPLLYPYRGRDIPQFAAACYDVLRSSTPPGSARSFGQMPPANSDGMLPLSELAVDDQGSKLVYWYGRGGPDGVFRYYSIHALILSAAKIRQGLPPDVPPQLFRDKLLIAGGSASGLYDFKPTPFTYLEQYPGMEIQATVLSNLLNGHGIRTVPWWVGALITVVLSTWIAWLFFRSHRIDLATVLVALTGILYAACVFAAFSSLSLWLPIVQPIFGLASTYAIAAVVSYAVEGQQKRLLRKAFNRYFSPNVVADILDHASQVELGGKTIEATVFFSDIKDFTSIAETFTPKDLVFFLNNYFTLACDVILRNEAMLDKYIGDAIMAIFGAPIPRPDNAKVACLTALEIQAALTAHHTRPDRDPRMPVFVTRIGLNTGKLVIGNIGSSNRQDYTAIGDTVNLASRLEGVNKMYGTKILVSETTYEQAKESIVTRELDFLRVKGKSIPVRIYELVGVPGDVPAGMADIIGLFEQGLGMYRKREFSQAATLFQKILTLDPHDGPSATYVKRCAELEHVPLLGDWDGVYTLTTK